MRKVYPLNTFVLTALAIFPQVVQSFSLHPQCRAAIQRPCNNLNLILHSTEQDDDGWGDQDTSGTSDPSVSFGDSDRTAKNRELERLQGELTAKRTSENTNNSAVGGSVGERDLFIPIFTLVAVVGFTGLYGYEMLRLYSRGELYLPWEQ